MKDFVPYQEAVALRELGFDEPCFAFFQVEYAESKPTMVDDEHEYRITGYRTCKNSEISQHYTSAPTYSQAFRFFREKYKLYHDIKMFGDWDKPQYSYYVSGRTMNNQAHMWHYENVNSYPEAELACLKKLIELVKNKEK